jgi:hypothetical protein
VPTTDAGLPFSGATQLSRFTSHAGAEGAKKRALPQVVRYLQLLHARYPDGLTDAEAADLMAIERSSINARRAPLVEAGLVETYGSRERVSTEIPNTIWRLRLPSRGG